MSNILIFLIHFSIISNFKNNIAINNKINNEKINKSNCFIVNRNLYNNTLTHRTESNKFNKLKLNDVKVGNEIISDVKKQEVAVESPNGGLKSIVDNGSIKSSSLRHEILDKESLLDDLIVSNEQIHEVLEESNEEVLSPGTNLKYIPGKFDEGFKELESSVLKKAVYKKEQVIKPSHKILKRRSKETIYTRLQNYVKSSENFLTKYNLLDEAKNFVHLFHWNAWHTLTSDRRIECNWTNNQFEQFHTFMEKIDRIINDELNSFLEITTNTEHDLMSDIVEQRTSFLFSSNNIYKRIKANVDLSEFYAYRERMKNIFWINVLIKNQIREVSLYLTRYRNWNWYRAISNRVFRLKSRISLIKNRLMSKLRKSKIFGKIMPKGVKPGYFGENRAESLEDLKIHLDRLSMQKLLLNLSHSHLSRERLRNLEEINRNALYAESGNGDWSLHFVGSGSRQPTKTRLTSTIAFRRREKPNSIWLFDCGEGTKNALESIGLDPCQVERIFLTHLHGDHCYGIFSFLYLRERTNPLEIYGPPGIRRLINSIHQNTSTSTYNNFTIHELLAKPSPNGNTPPTTQNGTNGANSSNTQIEDIYINKAEYYNVYEEDDVQILGAPLEHTMPTVGYVIQKTSKGGHHTEPYASASENGFYRPRYYRQFARKGEEKKIVICQDSSDSSKMAKIAMDADVLIHEATLSSTTSRISGIIMDLIKNHDSIVLCQGTIRRLYKFMSDIEVKLGCFNFTLSALTSFVKCERYYMLQKLNILKNFIDTFKPLDKEENKAPPKETGNKKEMEKLLKEKWLNMVFLFMDRLNGFNELNKYEYFVKRLQNRYNLKEKLCQVLPSMDLTGVIDASSKNFLFSRMVRGHNVVNDAYEQFDIPGRYGERSFVELLDYLNSISPDIFEYWREILQIPDSPRAHSTDSINNNWTMLYNRIIGSFGHSTPNMAGKFASEINAKKLILTHFSNKYPGDEKLVNLLTMIRIENEARLGYNKGGSKTIPVIAAWDTMRVNL